MCLLPLSLVDCRSRYCATLDARVIYENQHLCFITYNDEHHPVAFVDPGPLAARAPVLPVARFRAGVPVAEPVVRD